MKEHLERDAPGTVWGETPAVTWQLDDMIAETDSVGLVLGKKPENPFDLKTSGLLACD